MKVRVREGYVLFIGNRSYQAKTVVEVTEKDVKGQEWKIEAVNGKTDEPQSKLEDLDETQTSNRMMKRPTSRRSLEDEAQG